MICPASLVYKSIGEEMLATPGFPDKLDEVIANAGWAPAYRSHPVVRDNPACRVIPLALYMDGGPVLKRDYCTDLWARNLVTDTRHLTLVLRNQELCKCGRKVGVISMLPFEVLDWMLPSMADGIYAPHRHIKEPWAYDDPNKLLRRPAARLPRCNHYCRSTTGWK